MTYKQFIQELEDDVLPGEAERRYMFLTHANGSADIELSSYVRHIAILICAGIRSTNQSTFLLKSVHTLRLTKTKNGSN